MSIIEAEPATVQPDADPVGEAVPEGEAILETDLLAMPTDKLTAREAHSGKAIASKILSGELEYDPVVEEPEDKEAAVEDVVHIDVNDHADDDVEDLEDALHKLSEDEKHARMERLRAERLGIDGALITEYTKTMA